MEFIKKLDAIVATYPKNTGFLVAYSGGADSTALLYLLAHMPNIRAIHINHGLQADADQWQQHCMKTCKKLSIKLVIEQASLADASENTCRKARYDFFSKHLKKNEVLVTAHHNQDQVETVLLKLFRGTGIKGLTGIDSIRPFSKGYIARPLLSYSASSLKNYLTEKGLNWIEDQSNKDNNFKRNFIRNKLVPSIQNEFPNAIENISRSAFNTNNSLQLLNHYIDFKGSSLKLDKLESLPKELQATLLYHWLAHKNMPTPDKLALKQISHDFIHANKGKQPHYKNNFYQLYRWKGAIYCIKNYEIIPANQSYIWDIHEKFSLPNKCGEITFTGDEGLQLSIKFNQTGEKLKTHKHKFSKTVKQLFQENHIPIWQRHNTPFIYSNGELVSLGFDWSSSSKFKNLKLSSIDLIIP